MRKQVSSALFFAALGGLFAAALCAQNSTTKIDAGHSYAILWMGRDTEVSVAVNAGVAQAGGTANLTPKDSATASLEVNLVPGGGGARLLTTEGTLRSGEIAAIARYAVMSFHTKGARVRRDGRLVLPGELTVTHVTRELQTGAWNFGYSGSTNYSDPVAETTKRPIRFVVVSPHAEFLEGYLNARKEIIAAATIEARDFPELPGIVLGSDWPIVAEDENCPPPVARSIRDYSGVTCNGTAIGITNATSERHSFSVDYSGMRRAVAPVDGPVTIVLHLKLLPASPAN